jgi:glycosyltransferase involved in cell wall biosynthesis
MRRKDIVTRFHQAYDSACSVNGLSAGNVIGTFMTLRFSIVVPTLDRREMLLSAIASIRDQNWPCVEIIVVDGGSVDGTIEQISMLSDVCMLEGPDRGVYDAFNKGIARATGDVIGILNSDDRYEPGSFAAVAEAFARNPDAHAICGSAILMEDERIVAKFEDDASKRMTSPYTVLIGQPMPNARFFRRSAMATIGAFSLEYPYVADRDWLVRWREAGLITIAIPQRVYRYRQHAGSMTYDPRGPRTAGIRADLLALAQNWRSNLSASSQARRAAALLEGRCRAMLALGALSRGKVAEATRLLLTSAGRPSLAPLGYVICSAADRVLAPMFPAGRAGARSADRR